MTDPWPWPADTQLDRARRIAQSYRDALAEVAPEYCSQLDDRARKFGQEWVAPELVTVDVDDLLPAADVAKLVGVQRQTIYQWAHRRFIPTHHEPNSNRSLYRVGDVFDHIAATRRKRAAGRTAHVPQ